MPCRLLKQCPADESTDVQFYRCISGAKRRIAIAFTHLSHVNDDCESWVTCEDLIMSVDMTALAKTALTGDLEHWLKELRGLVDPLTEEQFWKKPIEPGNSVGHLVLHLTGNLSHFVGAQLGKTGYVRDRDREFNETKVPAKDVALARLDEAVAMVRRVVEGLTPEQLAAPHPTERLGLVLPGLMHLVSHFALHRGQISYIVRLVTR
jgi:uncharacterized damage-inducible protein DinB